MSLITSRFTQRDLFVCFDFIYHTCAKKDVADTITALIRNSYLPVADQQDAFELMCDAIREYRTGFSVKSDRNGIFEYTFGNIRKDTSFMKKLSSTDTVELDEDCTPLGPYRLTKGIYNPDYEVWTGKNMDALFKKVFR